MTESKQDDLVDAVSDYLDPIIEGIIDYFEVHNTVNVLEIPITPSSIDSNLLLDIEVDTGLEDLTWDIDKSKNIVLKAVFMLKISFSLYTESDFVTKDMGISGYFNPPTDGGMIIEGVTIPYRYNKDYIIKKKDIIEYAEAGIDSEYDDDDLKDLAERIVSTVDINYDWYDDESIVPRGRNIFNAVDSNDTLEDILQESGELDFGKKMQYWIDLIIKNKGIDIHHVVMSLLDITDTSFLYGPNAKKIVLENGTQYGDMLIELKNVCAKYGITNMAEPAKTLLLNIEEKKRLLLYNDEIKSLLMPIPVYRQHILNVNNSTEEAYQDLMEF